MVCLTFRLSSKSLLTSEDYDQGAGIRKRHKGPEEDQDALIGMAKSRGRNQSWDDHESSSDFMSQVSKLKSCRLTGTQSSTWGAGGHTGDSEPFRWRSVGPCCCRETVKS